MIVRTGTQGFTVQDWAGDEARFSVNDSGDISVEIDPRLTGVDSVIVDIAHHDAISLIDWLTEVTK